MSTHYDTLGLEPTASADDIKRAYRAFSRRHHPDIAGPDSAPLFAEGTTAYTILSDPQQRAAYDHELANPTPEPEPDIPLDDWGQDESWEQEAPWGDEGDVVDAPIVDPQNRPRHTRHHPLQALLPRRPPQTRRNEPWNVTRYASSTTSPTRP